MDNSSWESPLCVNCRSITYEMLATEFQHSLTYQETVESGKTCKFCRLIVCSMSKLQLYENICDMYEVDRDYDHWSQILPGKRYVAQSSGPDPATNLPVQWLVPLKNIQWTRNSETSAPFHNGYFNSGATIQLNAPKGSIYEEFGLLAVHDIEAANSPRNTHMIREWLRNCIEEHPSCRRSFCSGEYELDKSFNEVHQLPNRVIQVGTSNNSVKLFVSAGETGMYTTLSHQWGKEEKLCTLRENIQEHQRSITFDRLPQTFKDAIEITRNLSIKYLWIDSLCIIQDDRDDWEREAAQMGTIFEHSTCTIAAIDAIAKTEGDSEIDLGLFIPRVEDPLMVRLTCASSRVPVEIVTSDGVSAGVLGYLYEFISKRDGVEMAEPTSEEMARHQIIARPRLLSGPETIFRSSWNRRGWILQERILSRRIIYYTKKKLFWECNSHHGEEEMLGIDATAGRACWPVKGYLPWKSLVRDYSNCLLTFEEDKLTAILGLSKRLEERTGRICHAGIFEDDGHDIGNCLLWRANGPDPLRIYPKFHAPSWSWAAYEGPISYFTLPMQPSTSFFLISKPLAFKTQSKCLKSDCTNSKGTCVSGGVCFEGPVGEAFISTSLENWSLEDEGLISVLGSAVHMEGKLPPRYLDGVLITQKRELFIPTRTRVLKDNCGTPIGWVLLDTDVVNLPDDRVICAAVTRWKRTGPPVALFGPVKGFDYTNEENVDILALQVKKGDIKSLERIGRGRIVIKEWLETCSMEEVSIW